MPQGHAQGQPLPLHAAAKGAVGATDDDEGLATDIMASTRTRIAHYKCPTSIDFIDVLPRNPSGKLLKRELRQPYWADGGRNIH